MRGNKWQTGTSKMCISDTMPSEHAGELKLLSEQYLMDCSWPFGNQGCNGGFQEPAFEFTISNGGLPSAKEYPYHGVNMACRNETPLTVALSRYVSLPLYNATVLKEAILTKGPMAISINVDDPGFQFYKKGTLSQLLWPLLCSNPRWSWGQDVARKQFGGEGAH
jgi:hypothetical protein